MNYDLNKKSLRVKPCRPEAHFNIMCIRKSCHLIIYPEKPGDHSIAILIRHLSGTSDAGQEFILTWRPQGAFDRELVCNSMCILSIWTLSVRSFSIPYQCHTCLSGPGISAPCLSGPRLSCHVVQIVQTCDTFAERVI